LKKIEEDVNNSRTSGSHGLLRGHHPPPDDLQSQCSLHQSSKGVFAAIEKVILRSHIWLAAVLVKEGHFSGEQEDYWGKC
jgi:hypothetical protein